MTAASNPDQNTPQRLRVAIISKRYTPLDEQVTQLLAGQLTQNGFQVFTDRNFPVGLDWARELTKQIRDADAVVPILSAGAAQSEMIAYEVELAHEEAQRRQGRPRLLPVRVHFSGQLPEPLAGMLPVQTCHYWNGPEDDGRLVAEMMEQLRNLPPQTEAGLPAKGGGLRVRPRPATEARTSATSSMSSAPLIPDNLEPIGGAVPLGSEFYLARPQDGELRAALTRYDSIILIKGARQMGKTSLLARGLQHGRERGAKVVLTDFQKLNLSDLESPANFYMALGESLAEQLDLSVFPQDIWEERRGANVNFERYLRREVLARFNAPLVWGLDEMDRLFTCSFGSEVFGLFRSWHNERALDPSGPWAGLTLAIAYATEAHLFITDMNQSPFNVGTRLALDDFTSQQVADLNRRYRSPLKNQDELDRFQKLFSGHPFLVRRALHEMATERMPLAQLEDQADRDEGIFGDHLRRMLVLLARDPALTEVVLGVLCGQPCPTQESFYRLRSAGLVTGQSPADARPRCQLYASYLKRHLLEL
jgi:hypothetical protein